MFTLKDFWVWDFWIADDGNRFHLYYLHAPTSLGDQHLRHRNARIGHASSLDLSAWEDHGEVLRPGQPGEFDETATWTGSVIRGADGIWRMFYTGSTFLEARSHANVETIGVATSPDLFTWTKRPDPLLEADARWYERLGDSGWPEEAWRDPWVFEDADGEGWHMLITARGRHGADLERGVVGYAWSPDLDNWEIRPPLSGHSKRFPHLEVLQVQEVLGTTVLIFSATANPTSSDHGASPAGGIWAVDNVDATGPFDVDGAVLLADQRIYSGRIVTNRFGESVLLAFENETGTGEFVGTITDPIPLMRDKDGCLFLDVEEVAATK